MLLAIPTILVLLGLAVLGYALSRPDTFRIQRSVLIAAPPEQVYPLIVDLHKWSRWSPYEKLDPTMQRMHTGAEFGPGAVYSWSGNKRIGQGRMEIVDVQPPRNIMIKLDFVSPFEAHNIVDFTLAAKDGGKGPGTEVTWAMHGPQPYLSKLMGLFFSMDQMVGGQFAEGLASLKVVAEATTANVVQPE